MTQEDEKPEYHLGHHELLHVASIAQDFVDRHLLDHEQIETIPEWKKLAGDASEALFLLYQSIGEYADKAGQFKPMTEDELDKVFGPIEDD